MELSNITELIRTDEICRLLRLCGADERRIGAEASDYEFFSTLCDAVPLLTGHPLLHALENALKNELGVTASISPDTCCILWKTCADRLLQIRRFKPLTIAPFEAPDWTPPMWRVDQTHILLEGASLLPTKACSWSEWEAEMRVTLDVFCKSGGDVVLFAPDAAVCAEVPNLYRVEQSLRHGVHTPMLTAQVFRFLAVELQKRNMILLIDTKLCGEGVLNLLNYAERSVGLPRLIWMGADRDTCQALWAWQSCPHGFEIRYAVNKAITDRELQAIAHTYPIGRLWKLSCEPADVENTATVTIYRTI